MEFSITLPVALDENNHIVKYWRNIIEGYKVWNPQEPDEKEKPISLLSYLARKEIEQLGECFDPAVLNFAAVCLELFHIVEQVCIPKILLLYERAKFFSLVQGVSESFNGFFERLTSQANICEFGDKRESVLVEKVISGIRDESIRKRLRAAVHLNLSKVLRLFASLEAKGKSLKGIKERVSEIDRKKLENERKRIISKKQAIAYKLKKKKSQAVKLGTKKKSSGDHIEEVGIDERAKSVVSEDLPEKEVEEESSNLRSQEGGQSKVLDTDEASEVIPKKRGRGRPRKEPNDKLMDTVQKKRGRPKKESNVNPEDTSSPVLKQEITEKDTVFYTDNFLEQIFEGYDESSSALEFEKELRELAELEKGTGFQCDECGKLFGKRINLRQHIMRKHESLTVACDLCNTRLTTQSGLKTHLKRHMVCHQCTRCPRFFKTSDLLQVHMARKHTESKIHQCDLCGVVVKTAASLRFHHKLHRGERPHICDMCGQGFATISNLKLHKRLHTGEKPYACPQCDYRSNHSSHLKVHMRTHTKESPYVCELCGKAFKVNSHLTKHMATHTGMACYKCHICGNEYRQRTSLKAHHKSHHPDIEDFDHRRTRHFPRYQDLRDHSEQPEPQLEPQFEPQPEPEPQFQEEQMTYEIHIEEGPVQEIVLDSETIAAAEALVSTERMRHPQEMRRNFQYGKVYQELGNASTSTRILTLDDNLIHQSESGVFSVIKITPDGTIITALD